MSTLSQNVKQVIHDFDTIKDAIEYKGVEIPEGTHTSEYAEKIHEIETGITPTGTISIIENGTGIDVAEYASADVNVETYEAVLTNLIERDITSIDIPQGTTVIGYGAFYGCTNLESVTIPNSVTTIIQNAFFDCSSLTSIIIPSGVHQIEDCVFQNCASLTNVTLHNNITSIGSQAFSGCGFSSFTIPDSVNVILSAAFSQCENLTNISIPMGVEYISDACFSYCTSLESAIIPSSVTEIIDRAFADCPNFTDIYYTGTQAQWESITKGTDAIPTGATVHYEYTPE